MMGNNPLVSVVIPTYNRAKLVCEAILSVLNQTYKNIEIIVVDDGSTDNTREEILTQIKGKLIYTNDREFELITKNKNNRSEIKLKYIYQENSGVSSARNTGIRNAKGEYIALLDSDDLFLPRKIEMQVREFLNSSQSIGAIFVSHAPTDLAHDLDIIFIPKATNKMEALSPLLNEFMQAHTILALSLIHI